MFADHSQKNFMVRLARRCPTIAWCPVTQYERLVASAISLDTSLVWKTWAARVIVNCYQFVASLTSNLSTRAASSVWCGASMLSLTAVPAVIINQIIQIKCTVKELVINAGSLIHAGVPRPVICRIIYQIIQIKHTNSLSTLMYMAHWFWCCIKQMHQLWGCAIF